MTNEQKRLIGLTGGIATGKSTVASYLAKQHNLPMLDADLYAREAVRSGSPILADIFRRYGEQVKLPNDNLNRQALGNIIFNNERERKWLESKIHPYVKNCFARAIEQIDAQQIVLVIPLLLEANMTDLVTEIWVVYCSRSEQLQRLMQRDRLTLAQAEARIDSQLSLETKVKAADVVLDNNFGLENLFRQIDRALNAKV